MKKYSFAKFTVHIFLAVWAIFFINCSKENEDALPEVPSVSVSDGKLDEHNEKKNYFWKNKIVTQKNLDDFAQNFDDAMHGTNTYSYSYSLRETQKNEGKNNLINGNYGGHFVEEFQKEKTDNYVKETSSRKFFNFSQNGILFLGGAFGDAFYMKNDGVKEIKINGEISFNGAYTGSVVYNNFYIKRRKDNAELESSGKVVVKSGGNEIDFNKYWYLCKKYWYFY